MARTLLVTVLAVLLKASTQRNINSHGNSDCSYESENLALNWSYDELSNDVVFKMVARNSKSASFYTPVAFGDETPNDVVTVYVRNGQIGLIDGHLDSEEGTIEADEKTNVQALGFDLQNGVLTAQFARPVETSDEDDAYLGNCITMFLPVESHEIVPSQPLIMPTNLNKIRICDIVVTCTDKKHSDVLVKRQQEAICASGPESQKNRITWTVDGDNVVFDVNQNAKKGRWWTAIGVGSSMENLNLIGLFAENGRLKHEGIYRTEGKMQPEPFEIENVALERRSANVKGGRAQFEIAVSKRFFTEAADESGCFTLQIAILAGNYKPKFLIGKHKQTPTAIEICNLDACGASSEFQLDPTTTTTTTEAAAPQEASTVTAAHIEIASTVASPASLSTTEEAKQPILTVASTPIPAVLNPDVEGSAEVPTMATVEVEGSGQGDVTPLTNELDGNPTGKGCGANHEDLKVCESYFAEYLGKVDEWSKRHNMTIASHMWKACTLLSQVQHVTTMCCTIFRSTCATHLQL
ncbi:unnamed protein product [Caenorhabditis bovis]|uniref:DOMON domain-containing protein n=1 Tax=Caenorhabditis bovis TaxID=2654633 RepID=A0A8S1F753_9PELO|nr:unnamed protein product [Caenorhabditis bovis]